MSASYGGVPTMEENGGFCPPSSKPQHDSCLAEFRVEADISASGTNGKVSGMETHSEDQAHAERSSTSAVPDVSHKRSDSNTSETQGGTDGRGKKERANGSEGHRYRRRNSRKESTVSTAWDALVDTFAQCYFTLRRDEKGCHALSPPLPTRNTEGVTSRQNAKSIHGSPEAIALRDDATLRYLANGATGRNVRCLPGMTAVGREKTVVSDTAASSASIAAIAAASANSVIGPLSLQATDLSSPSHAHIGPLAASDSYNLALPYSAATGHGKEPLTLGPDRWPMPLGQEEKCKYKRRRGVVSDAEVVDRLTRQMIADLQRHFAERNGVVTSAEFVYTFRQLFRRHESQSETAAATGVAGELPIGLAARAEEKAATVESVAVKQEKQPRDCLSPLGKKPASKGDIRQTAATVLKSLEDSTTEKTTALYSTGHTTSQVDSTTGSALAVREGDIENESGHPVGVIPFDKVHPPANPAEEKLWQQRQEEKELLEVQQLLDVFALIDVNDNGAISWEQFTRFIIDRGRNEDFLKRMHLQRLEGRDMKETRSHLSPVESLTVAYDPPLSLDLVFYFEENSKTVEVLRPDLDPSCPVPQPAAAQVPLQCFQQTTPPALSAFPGWDSSAAAPEAATLSAASGHAAEDNIRAAETYPFSSKQMLRDSILQQRVPLALPIRHSCTITAIAYCPSVQHLAVAAADLSLSFYNVRHAGVSGCRQPRPTGKTGNKSPINNGSPGIFPPTEAADRRNGGTLNEDETNCWKATCSFKTRTSQIILYPSPGRPLLFSADHEGSIYAWDLLRICRAESATSTTDDETSQLWRNVTEGRGGEQQATSIRTGANFSAFSSLPYAAHSASRASLLNPSIDTTADARVPIIRSRRKAMRFDSGAIATTPINLGSLIAINRPQQQVSCGGRSDGISDAVAATSGSTADVGGKGKGEAQRAIPPGGSGPALQSAGSASQKVVASEKERIRGSAPNVPPLRFPAKLQAAGKEDNHGTGSTNEGNRNLSSRKKLSIFQRGDGGSAVNRLGSSSRTDPTSCDPPSSLTSSNGGRSLSSASRSTGSLYEKGRSQLHQQQSQHGRRHNSRLHVSSGSRYVTAGLESPHGGTDDTSALNSSSRLSGASVIAHGFSTCLSPCSSSSQKSLQRVNSQQQSQFLHQLQKQKEGFYPREPAYDEVLPTSPTSSSCTRSTVSALAPTGSRKNSIRSRLGVSGTVHKHVTRFDHFDPDKAVTHQKEDTRIVDTEGVNNTQHRGAGNNGNGIVAGHWRDRTTRKGSPKPPGVQLEDTATADGQYAAGVSQSIHEADGKPLPEDPRRNYSNASARVATISSVQDMTTRPRMTGKDFAKGSTEPLGRQQQMLTGSERTTCLCRDGKPGSSNRTLTSNGLRPYYTTFNGRYGAAAFVPSEPQSHLLRWRQLHAHSDIVSGFQELEGGTDMLASCAMDKRIILWSASTGEQKRVLDGHVRGIRALCFDIESRALLSGGFDYKLFVWNPYVGKKVHTIRGHSAPIVSICMLAGGSGGSKRQFLSCDSEGIVKTWDLSSSACLQTLLAEDLLPSSGGQLRALVALPHRQMLLGAAGRKLVALVYGAVPGSASAESSSKQSPSQHHSKGQYRNTATFNGSGHAAYKTDTSSSSAAGLGRDASVAGKAGDRVVSRVSSREGVAGIQKDRTQLSAGNGIRGGMAAGAGGGSNWSRTGTVKNRAPTHGFMGRQDSGNFTGVADICKGLPREGEPLTKAVAHAGVRVLVTAGTTNLRVWDLCTGVLISSITHDCSGCNNSVGRNRRSASSSCTAAGNATLSRSNGRAATNTSKTTTQKSGRGGGGGGSTGQGTNCLNAVCHHDAVGSEESRSNGTDLNKAKAGEGSGLSLGKPVLSNGEATRVSKIVQRRSDAEGAHVITDICLDRSGRKVFVADHFGCLCAYSVCTGQVVRRLAAHAAEISHLVYAAEDRNLISVSWDRSIVVHNDAPSSVGAAAAVAASSTSLSSAVSTVASSSDHRLMAAQQPHQATTTDGETAVLQKFFATGDAAEDATAYNNNTAAAGILMNAQKQACIGESGWGARVSTNAEVVGPSSGVLHGYYTGSTGSQCVSSNIGGSSNNSLVWNNWGASVEEEKREDEMSKIWRRVDNAHLGDVTCCAYSRRLGLLATGGVDKAIFIWNYERLRRIACLFGHREDVAVLAFAEPLPFLCSADLGGTICIWVVPPHPRAVRVLEAQSVGLTWYERRPLSHLLTTTETPPSTAAVFSSNTNTSRTSPPVHSRTSPSSSPAGPGAAEPSGGSSHDGLSRQHHNYSSNTRRNVPRGSAALNRQLTCSTSSSFSSSPGKVASSVVDVGSGSSRKGAPAFQDDVGEKEQEELSSPAQSAARVGGLRQSTDATTSSSSTGVGASPKAAAASPPGREKNARMSSLAGGVGASCQSPPRSRPSSASVSFRLDSEQTVPAAEGTRVAGEARKGSLRSEAKMTTRNGFTTQESYSPFMENSNIGNFRSPVVPLVGADTAEEGAVPPTLLLVVIEDMEDITGTVPIVSLTALCRNRKRARKKGLLALPPSGSRRLLPLPEYAQEQQQLSVLSTGLSYPCLPPTGTRQATAKRREEEEHFLQGFYTKKSTTFLTSSDASEPYFPQNGSSPSSTRGYAASNNTKLGVGSPLQPPELPSASPPQHKGTRRASRKKSRNTSEIVSRVQQQQEEEAAAAARDARWPQEAEFLLFAGDEQGRVRVWDVSFLLQQLKGTRYIRKKTEWNPYRIWREELKESTLNIFRERVQQQQQQQQHLTRIVEQEEKTDEDLLTGGSPVTGSKRLPSPGGTTNGILRAGGIRSTQGRAAAAGDGSVDSSDGFFSLPSTRIREEKKAHDAATVAQGNNQNRINNRGEEGSRSGGGTTTHKTRRPPTKAATTTAASNAVDMSSPGSEGGAAHRQQYNNLMNSKW